MVPFQDMGVRGAMQALLAEASAPSAQKVDALAVFLETVRKKLAEHKRGLTAQAASDPLAEYASEFVGELDRILRMGVVDLEKAMSFIDDEAA